MDVGLTEWAHRPISASIEVLVPLSLGVFDDYSQREECRCGCGRASVGIRVSWARRRKKLERSGQLPEGSARVRRPVRRLPEQSVTESSEAKPLPRAASPEEQATFNRMMEMHEALKVPRLTRRHVWGDFQGKRFRGVRNRIWYEPKGKPFHEFLVNHLLWTLGKPWFDAEMKKPEDQRHIVLRWRQELLEAVSRITDQVGQVVSLIPTGDMKSLLVLADDVWQVEQVQAIPDGLRARLGNYAEFQGARYEIAVAATFIRAGFNLELIAGGSTKRPEFLAQHKASGLRVAVEAKSPRRAEVLHEEPRSGRPPGDVKTKVGRLLGDAFEQVRTTPHPGLVFVDLNLPLTPGVPTPQKPWFADLETTVLYQLSRSGGLAGLAGVVVTNFGWHYYRDSAVGDGEYLILELPIARASLPSEAWERLSRALEECGFIPDPEEHERRVKALFPEFNPHIG